MSGLPLFAGPVFTSRPLRPHQVNAIAGLRYSLAKGNRRVVLQLPTGAGKTRTAAEIVSGALAKGNRVAFTVPAISLIDQTVEAFESEGIDAVGVMQSNHPRTDVWQPVQVCSVQTLAKRARPPAEVVIVDECHLRFKAISDWMRDCPEARFIGLSATPWSKGMADEWQDLVLPVRMQDLIDQGFLSPFRVYAPSHPDLTGVRTVAGDYAEADLAAVMGETRLVADVVETWLKLAEQRPTLVFAVNRAHAALIQREFARAGVQMGYCDAFTDRIERAVLFDQMATGAIAGIVNVGTLTTGVDADVRCVVLARPTKSEMLFVQCIGRGLRTAPGKADCLILDHSDNHARLGFVTDIHHTRLLTGKDKKPATRKELGEKMPRECSKCGALKEGRECGSCGFTPERQSDIEFEKGELVEAKRTKVKESRGDKQRFWSMAIHVDKQRGKGGKLAKALYRGRFGVWPTGLAHIPTAPDQAFQSYETARRIAYAKSKAPR